MITKKQVHEEMLDASVAEVISKLVSNPKFSDLIRSKINMEVDTSALDQEIANYEKQLRQLYHNKDTILSDIDSLDYEDKHYQRRKTDLENRLYKTYDKIDEAEELLISAKTKKRALLADKITGDNIYKALIFFDKLYGCRHWTGTLSVPLQDGITRNTKGVNICQEWDLLEIAFTKKD